MLSAGKALKVSIYLSERSDFHRDAVRIAQSFSATILDNFLGDGAIREKSNVESGSATFRFATGYRSNAIGFGWANAVHLGIQDLLQEARLTSRVASSSRC